MLMMRAECYQIRGSIFEVYRELGCGFLEAVYQESLAKEFAKKGVPFVAQPELELFYKGELLGKTYRPDFVCYGKVIVELKALSQVNQQHRAQVLNYLKASTLRVGLLANFGAYPRATVERLVW